MTSRHNKTWCQFVSLFFELDPRNMFYHLPDLFVWRLVELAWSHAMHKDLCHSKHTPFVWTEQQPRFGDPSDFFLKLQKHHSSHPEPLFNSICLQPQTCVSLVSLIHHLMVRNISGISSHKLLNFSCSSGRVPEAVQLLHTACPKHGANSSDRWKPWCVNTSNSLASFKLCANWKLPHAFVSWRGRRVSVNKPSALAENIGSLGIAAHRYRRVGVAWPAEKLGRAGYMGGHRRPMKSDCFLLISAIRQPVEMLQFLCVLLRNWVLKNSSLDQQDKLWHKCLDKKLSWMSCLNIHTCIHT